MEKKETNRNPLSLRPSHNILVHNCARIFFPSNHPYVALVLFSSSTAFAKETGTVGKLKTSVLIPLFCWINIHTCHGSKSFAEIEEWCHTWGNSRYGMWARRGCEHNPSHLIHDWRTTPNVIVFFIEISNSYITMIVVMRGWFSLDERGSSGEKDF